MPRPEMSGLSIDADVAAYGRTGFSLNPSIRMAVFLRQFVVIASL